MPKIKNIIIFVAIAIVLILLYVFFIKKGPEEASLVSTSPPIAISGDASSQGAAISADFLGILLNVKNISLEDSLFSDPAFLSLHDSSIELIPDGTEGRPNPFAPIGFETVSAPISNTSTGATSPLPTYPN